MMTTGEKRSLTSSLNKQFGLFTKMNPLDEFASLQQWLSEFYSFWFAASEKANVSWTKNPCKEQAGFEKEMKIRIKEQFQQEVGNLADTPETEKPCPSRDSVLFLKSLRSNKKRLKKKRQKKAEELGITESKDLKKGMTPWREKRKA